jgi:hypothetical protein
MERRVSRTPPWLQVRVYKMDEVWCVEQGKRWWLEPNRAAANQRAARLLKPMRYRRRRRL